MKKTILLVILASGLTLVGACKKKAAAGANPAAYGTSNGTADGAPALKDGTWQGHADAVDNKLGTLKTLD